MVQIRGTYRNIRQENVEQFLAASGVPYYAQKMMAMSNPILEICDNGLGDWRMRLSSHIRNENVRFQLGKEYQEISLCNDHTFFRSVTMLKGEDTLETRCFGIYDVIFTKTYQFSEDGCVLTMTHKETGTTAKRYFERVTSREENQTTSEIIPTTNNAVCIA